MSLNHEELHKFERTIAESLIKGYGHVISREMCILAAHDISNDISLNYNIEEYPCIVDKPKTVGRSLDSTSRMYVDLLNDLNSFVLGRVRLGGGIGGGTGEESQ